MSNLHVTVDGGIAHVVIDRPPLNILTRSVLFELRESLDRLSADASLRVLVLCATGRHFSAGADVDEHLPPTVTEMIPEFLATVRAIDAFPLPTLAAVQGKCLGGGMELVLGTDIVTAADNAVLGQPEIVLGVVPPAACAILPTRAPRGVVSEIVYAGDPLDAAEAQRAGLVRYVVPAAELEERTFSLARRIARHSAAVLRVAKRTLRGPDTARHDTAMAAAGTAYLDDLMRTSDAVEGLTAFVEKRAPAWSHR